MTIFIKKTFQVLSPNIYWKNLEDLTI